MLKKYIKHTIRAKQAMKKNIEYYPSSGNVFKDGGLQDPEDALAKANLILKIDRLIKQKKLTQKDAAKLLGTTQPKISALLRGKLSSFTFDLLFQYLRKLDQSIEISTTIKTGTRADLSIRDTETRTPAH